MDILFQTWPWYIAGPAIALVMFLLLYMGGNFGVSANLRTLCAMNGGNRFSDFFDFDWRSQIWNLVFILGAVIGGFIAAEFLTMDQSVPIAGETAEELKAIGFDQAGEQFLPPEIFSPEALLSIKGWIILILGGFLVGFGARWAGGCTSGHAISGISDLQIPSILAVIGFFIGGLIMTHFLIPIIF